MCVYSISNKLSDIKDVTFKLYEFPQVQLIDYKKMHYAGLESIGINMADLNNVKFETGFRIPSLYNRLSYNIFYKHDKSIDITEYGIENSLDFGNIINYNYEGLIKFGTNIKESKEIFSSIFLIKKFIIDTEIQHIERNPDVFTISMDIKMPVNKTSDKIYFEISSDSLDTKNSFSSTDLTNLMMSIMKNRLLEKY